jgi:diguanylate cyclase (GGDEF)-like protein
MNAMDMRPIKVLLIEDSPGDARLLREALADGEGMSFELECADRLSAGLERLAQGGIELLLLDLGLPDSQGLDTLARTQPHARGVPVIVLTGLQDEILGVKAVEMAAQDYLVKGQLDSELLVRAMRYAIERHRLLAELQRMSFVDDLTGLRNRRGFFALAEQQVKLADRTKNGFLLPLADLDDLKSINDAFGHREGDLALIETARALKETFRESDIIARIGGDEFAVIAIEAGPDSAEVLRHRLSKNLEARNAGGSRRYTVSISLGIASYDPEHPCTIDELLARADAQMYEQKRSRPRL